MDGERDSVDVGATHPKASYYQKTPEMRSPQACRIAKKDERHCVETTRKLGRVICFGRTSFSNLRVPYIYSF